MREGKRQRCANQRLGHPDFHRIAHDFVGKNVFDTGQIQPAFRYASHPEPFLGIHLLKAAILIFQFFEPSHE